MRSIHSCAQRCRGRRRDMNIGKMYNNCIWAHVACGTRETPSGTQRIDRDIKSEFEYVRVTSVAKMKGQPGSYAHQSLHIIDGGLVHDFILQQYSLMRSDSRNTNARVGLAHEAERMHAKRAPIGIYMASPTPDRSASIRCRAPANSSCCMRVSSSSDN